MAATQPTLAVFLVACHLSQRNPWLETRGCLDLRPPSQSQRKEHSSGDRPWSRGKGNGLQFATHQARGSRAGGGRNVGLIFLMVDCL